MGKNRKQISTLECVRNDDLVNDLLNQCDEAEMAGGSKFPGMTYEQGIAAGINWLLGDSEDYPLD